MLRRPGSGRTVSIHALGTSPVTTLPGTAPDGRGALTAQWAGADLPEADIAAWRALHARALEPNPFYAPDFVLAGLRHLPQCERLRLLMIWRETGAARTLAGVFPLADGRTRYVVPAPVRVAADLYGNLSTPLIDTERPAETWSAMLDALAASGTRALLLPYGHRGGPSQTALTEVCSATARQTAVLGRHERALLHSSDDGATYLRATLETRRRKEADRQRRRLAEQGELDFHIARSADEVDAALTAFLDLESTGWKGRRGTDLKSAPGTAAFIHDLARGMAHDGTIRIVSLTSGKRLVASGIVVLSGRRAFYIKTTYDEALSRFSPGLLLTLDLTKHLLDDPQIADADSIAVADHPMIDHIWTDRFPIETVLVACRPGSDPVFSLIAGLERLRERVRTSTSEIRAKFADRGS
jgi:CelD/BcsL family acetyltransferase involved in cellulose biosynthesis